MLRTCSTVVRWTGWWIVGRIVGGYMEGYLEGWVKGWGLGGVLVDLRCSAVLRAEVGRTTSLL